jgi:oligoribonuclease
MVNHMLNRLVWIDCEMTGLDPDKDALVEVAAVVTDSELRLLDAGIDLVIATPAASMDLMEPVVRDMHARSGLTDAVAESTLSMADAEGQLLDYLQSHIPEAGKAPLCGNSIATDRAFLMRAMPAVDKWLHYRMIDVSSVKELARRWYPKAYYSAPGKQGGHRAMADILESVEELRYYRSTIFVPAADQADVASATAATPAAAEVVAD